MQLKAEFPVKAYLKRYVYWKENLEESELLDLSGPGEIPLVLGGILTGKLSVAPDEFQAIPSIYDDRLPFLLTVEQVNRNLMFFTIEGVRYFNTYLYRDFHETLLHSIICGKDRGVSEVDTINRWIDHMGIHDMISFDALKKASYRLRKEKKIPIFRCANSI